MMSELKLPRDKSGLHSKCISGTQHLVVEHLQYRRKVLPDAQATAGQVPAPPKSCLNPMMVPFQAFLHYHMSYLDGLVRTALIAFLEHSTAQTVAAA